MSAIDRRLAAPIDPSELLPIAERARHLGLLRGVLGLGALGACLVWPDLAGPGLGPVALATTAYLVTALLAALASARLGRGAVAIFHGALLVDGIYLGAIVGMTGGASSPLRSAMLVHVVAVTLLGASRTGLKLAAWHTVLFLLAAGWVDAGLVPGVDHRGVPSEPVGLTVGALWLLTLAAAAASAASERALRRQKVDLQRLADMMARIERSAASNEIPRILLEELRTTFGFERGVVLGSARGDLEALATVGDVRPDASGPVEAVDRVVSQAWERRAPVLVQRLDRADDPLLAALLPDATNVVVVPTYSDRGAKAGAVVLERGEGSGGMPRWVVAMLAQFVGQATLALHNAWLREDREHQLETITQLDRRLREHNAELEDTVAERTHELRDVIAELQEIDGQRRRLLAHVVQAAEEERRRIAGDIHDDPVQKMVSLKMRLEMLAKAHPGLPGLADTREAVASTIASLRHLLFDLRPPILDEEGLGAAIRYLLENTEVSFAWSVDDEIHVQPSTQTRVILYRIAQEALANARKHARADRVRVRLAERDGGVWMEIADDGVGFRPEDALAAAPGHLGLAAMRERAEMAGGSCALRSLPQAGTTLEVWLPPGEPEEGFDAADRAPAEVVPLPRSRSA